jgi:O-antigen/teichoic acid export membrane protein
MTLLDRLVGLTRSTHARAAVGASAWSVGGYAATTALRFISRIVLAKLLPDASPLGTVAVVATIISGLEMISDLGIGVNVVQHQRGAEPVFLGTAFSVQALRGLLLWAVASALAFPLSWLYHDPHLGPLLLFGALAVLLRGLASPGIAILQRNLQLRVPTAITVGAEVAGFAVTMAWALAAPSAWALVAGSVTTAAGLTIGSQLSVARTRFRWEREAARSIVKFGGWILIGTATWFLGSRGETLMLKGSVPDIEFGCFAFASMLVTTPATAVTQVGFQVFLPMMSAWLRNDPAAAVRQYRRARWASTALASCFAASAILVAPSLVKLLRLNHTFASLGWMVQFLGCRAAFDILSTPLTSMLLAAGASKYSARGNTVRLVAIIGSLLLTVPHWGLFGAMFALVGSAFVAYAAMLPGADRFLPGVVRLEIVNLLIFVIGVGAAIACYFWFTA